eukprot:3877937-Rhodomonas_salina.1
MWPFPHVHSNARPAPSTMYCSPREFGGGSSCGAGVGGTETPSNAGSILTIAAVSEVENEGMDILAASESAVSERESTRNPTEASPGTGGLRRNAVDAIVGVIGCGEGGIKAAEGAAAALGRGEVMTGGGGVGIGSGEADLGDLNRACGRMCYVSTEHGVAGE